LTIAEQLQVAYTITISNHLSHPHVWLCLHVLVVPFLMLVVMHTHTRINNQLHSAGCAGGVAGVTCISK
jgi:hypothetical protein